MTLDVFVQSRKVAALDQEGDFRCVLTYLPNMPPEDLVSLTMPVRVTSYGWDDVLHPCFQMNLPEGYLLQVLQEKLGPHITGSPMALLAVVGRNMVGRVQVAPPGADLNEVPQAFELESVLQGENSEEAFAELVRQHATSGIAGVIPKFLDANVEKPEKRVHNKATLLTRRHIIKGSGRLPYVSLNEHLCMQIAAKVLPTAKTELSKDGRALVVHRFDVDENGQPHWAIEDFCALLGLRPSAKYDTTWERIARAARDHVPGDAQGEVMRQFALILLLTYALRNSDCHAKNLSLLYTSRRDVQLSPVYDMVTTVVYEGYQDNPPGISVMGRKTWAPGKTLSDFIASRFSIAKRVQKGMVESISDAVSDAGALVREAMENYPGFEATGRRMLMTWHEGISGLRDKGVYSLERWKPNAAFEGFDEPPKLPRRKTVIGRSEGLGKRGA